MAAKTQEHIDQLEAALARNQGVAEVVTDGVKVRYNRRQLLEELRFWRRRLAYESKRRRVSRGVNLGGA